MVPARGICDSLGLAEVHLGSTDLTAVVGKILESAIKQDLATLKSLFSQQ